MKITKTVSLSDEEREVVEKFLILCSEIGTATGKTTAIIANYIIEHAEDYNGTISFGNMINCDDAPLM